MQFLRINMNEQTVTVEEVPQDHAGLGGRGLTSIMINNEVPPTCDPLGPENKLKIPGAKISLFSGPSGSHVGGTSLLIMMDVNPLPPRPT